MELDKILSAIGRTRTWLMAATVIGTITLGVVVYALFSKAKLPPPPDTIMLNVHEMVFTEDQQKVIFSNEKVTEVKFDWIPAITGNSITLSLSAVGGYMDGGRLVFDESNRQKLDLGNIICRDVSSVKYNFNSPVYFTRGDIKAFNGIGLGSEDPLAPDDIQAAIRMTPYCTSDATRNNTLYFEGSTGSTSRPANPMPPFTSPCVRCDE